MALARLPRPQHLENRVKQLTYSSTSLSITFSPYFQFQASSFSDSLLLPQHWISPSAWDIAWVVPTVACLRQRAHQFVFKRPPLPTFLCQNRSSPHAQVANAPRRFTLKVVYQGDNTGICPTAHCFPRRCRETRHNSVPNTPVGKQGERR